MAKAQEKGNHKEQLSLLDLLEKQKQLESELEALKTQTEPYQAILKIISTIQDLADTLQHGLQGLPKNVDVNDQQAFGDYQGQVYDLEDAIINAAYELKPNLKGQPAQEKASKGDGKRTRRNISDLEYRKELEAKFFAKQARKMAGIPEGTKGKLSKEDQENVDKELKKLHDSGWVPPEIVKMEQKLKAK